MAYKKNGNDLAVHVVYYWLSHIYNGLRQTKTTKGTQTQVCVGS